MDSNSLGQPTVLNELPEFTDKQNDVANWLNENTKYKTTPTGESNEDGVETERLEEASLPKSESLPGDDQVEQPNSPAGSDESPARSNPYETEFRCATPETYEDFVNRTTPRNSSPHYASYLRNVPYSYNPNSPTYNPSPSALRTAEPYEPNTPQYMPRTCEYLSVPTTPEQTDVDNKPLTPGKTESKEPEAEIDEDKPAVDSSDKDEPAAKKFKSSSDEDTSEGAII